MYSAIDKLGNYFVDEDFSSNYKICEEKCLFTQDNPKKEMRVVLKNIEENYSEIGLIDKTDSCLFFSTNSNCFEFGLYTYIDEKIIPLIAVKKENDLFYFLSKNDEMESISFPKKSVTKKGANIYGITVEKDRVVYYENDFMYPLRFFNSLYSEFDIAVQNKIIMIKLNNGKIFNIIGNSKYVPKEHLEKVKQGLLNPNFFIKDFEQ